MIVLVQAIFNELLVVNRFKVLLFPNKLEEKFKIRNFYSLRVNRKITDDNTIETQE